MFARFRNLFSKNKSEMDVNADSSNSPKSKTDTVTPDNANTGVSETNVAYVSSTDQSKLEGLNYLKSLVATEQEQLKIKTGTESAVNGSATGFALNETNGNVKNANNDLSVIENNSVKNAIEINKSINENQTKPNEITSLVANTNGNSANMETVSQIKNPNVEESKISENGKLPSINTDSENGIKHLNGEENKVLKNGIAETKIAPEVANGQKETAFNESSVNTETVSKPEIETDSVSDLLKKMKTEVMTLDYLTKETSPLPVEPQQTTEGNEPLLKNNREIGKTSLITTWIQENNANFIPPTPYPLLSTESAINLNTHSSVVMEDLPSEVTTPSPTVDGSVSGSSSNTSTLDSTSTRLAADPTKIIVNPIGDNGMACNAITNKLTDIAEVAESLDTVIRDIQENSQSVEVESNPSPRDKQMGTIRSTSSDDWHSRSTEDESFVTASEGRTSSFMSCNKSSCDFSEEGDDSTVNFEMPDVNSPFNMSFDESEHSYRPPSRDNSKTPTKLSENVDIPLNDKSTPSNAEDIENLHSESVTPTPAEKFEYIVDSIPVESETELEVAAIANAPLTSVLTESIPVPISMTPEVSSCSKQFDKTTRLLDENVMPAVNGQNAVHTNHNNKTTTTNVAWRRSKYYENITKQTIKGFL